MIKSSCTIIPLNLIFDYPVRWSKYQVLRDFIQNFYDSVSFEYFHDKIRYNLTEYSFQQIRMNSIYLRIPFRYDWTGKSSA
ncbi:hypothetical protein GGQ84_000710 [Desulfitispora alkaliphila]